MPPKRLAPSIQGVETLIREIRGQRVILDSDLAAIYGVVTKRLNEQFQRNRKRFPEDFAFQLTVKETNALRSQIATGSTQVSNPQSDARSRSQFATLKRGQNIKYRPYVFTEHGALMTAIILNTPRTVQMSVFVIRAFVKMRETLLGTRDLARKLFALEKKLTTRLDSHETAIVEVLQELMLIINPPRVPPAPPRPKIGFRP